MVTVGADRKRRRCVAEWIRDCLGGSKPRIMAGGNEEAHLGSECDADSLAKRCEGESLEAAAEDATPFSVCGVRPGDWSSAEAISLEGERTFTAGFPNFSGEGLPVIISMYANLFGNRFGAGLDQDCKEWVGDIPNLVGDIPSGGCSCDALLPMYSRVFVCICRNLLFLQLVQQVPISYQSIQYSEIRFTNIYCMW